MGSFDLFLIRFSICSWLLSWYFVFFQCLERYWKLSQSQIKRNTNKTSGVWLISSPRYTGGDSMFCTGSYATAAANAADFVHADNFQTTFWISFFLAKCMALTDRLLYKIFVVNFTLNFQGQYGICYMGKNSSVLTKLKANTSIEL